MIANALDEQLLTSSRDVDIYMDAGGQDIGDVIGVVLAPSE
jgi:hypothetical protein